MQMPESEAENLPDGTPVARRTMPGVLAAGAAGLVTAPYVRAGSERVLAGVSQADPTGLSALLPNPGGFRYYSVVGSVPRKGEHDYELRIDGLVDRARTYTLADLRALPQTRIVHDVQCAPTAGASTGRPSRA